MSFEFTNWKNVLQEYCVANRLAMPSYSDVEKGGADHCPYWICSCTVHDLSAVGAPNTKKVFSEQDAAKNLYVKLVNVPRDIIKDVGNKHVEQVANAQSYEIASLRNENAALKTQLEQLNMHFNSFKAAAVYDIQDLTNQVKYLRETLMAVQENTMDLVDERQREKERFDNDPVLSVRDLQSIIGLLGAGHKKGDGPQTAKPQRPEFATGRKFRKPLPKSEKKEIKKEVKKDVRKDLKQEMTVSRSTKANIVKQVDALIPARTAFRNLLTMLYKAFILPGEKETRAVRIQTGFNSSETALMKIHTRDDISFCPTADLASYSTYNELTHDSLAFLQFRDPVRHVVFWHPNTSKAAYAYRLKFLDVTTQNTLTEFIQNMSITAPFNLRWLEPICLEHQGGWKPHGQVLPVGRVKDRQGFFFLMKGSFVTVSFGGGGAVEIVPVIAVGDGYYEMGPQGNLTTGQLWNVSKTGYYQLGVLAKTAIPISFTMTVEYNPIVTDNQSGVYCHRMQYDFEEEAKVIDSARLLGVAFKLTPTTPEAAKGGFLYGKQFRQGANWLDQLGDPNSTLKSATAVVSNLNNEEGISADKGMYGWLKPTDPGDFDLKSDWGRVNVTNLVTYSFSVVPEHEYLGCFANIPASSLGERAFKWNSYIIGDYATDSQYRDTAPPQLTKEVLTKVIEGSKTIRQFHENPLHLPSLLNAIYKAGGAIVNGVVDYGPMVVDFFKKVKPYFDK